MSDHTVDDTLDQQVPAANRTLSSDEKFKAVSNVDRNAEGTVVNGPYEHVAPVNETAERATTDNTLFGTTAPIAGDRAGTASSVQPGLAQPIGGFIAPGDPEPEVERERERRRD
jgi:hypothetical protein